MPQLNAKQWPRVVERWTAEPFDWHPAEHHVALTATDGTETFSLNIAGVPGGASLSA